jgi:hypothetical protein
METPISVCFVAHTFIVPESSPVAESRIKLTCQCSLLTFIYSPS